MRYMGGKHRIGKRIAEYVLAARGDHSIYLEPFVGACGVFRHVAPHFELCGGFDVHEDLILMWRALQAGWIPPDAVSREEHGQLKNSPPSALRAFAGFGMSFGGDWFCGYTSARGDDYCGAAKRGLMKKITMVGHATFRRCDYRECFPDHRFLVYCDPPYRGTSPFRGARSHFDTDEFWSYMKKWAAFGATIFVSEYDAPDDVGIELVAEFDARTCMYRNDGWLVERLYRVKG